MSTNYYSVKIQAPRDLPVDVVRDAIHHAIASLMYTPNQRDAVRVQVFAAGGTVASNKITLVDIAEPLIPVGKKVGADHLDDDLWAVIEWALGKMCDERIEDDRKARESAARFGSGSAVGVAGQIINGLPEATQRDLAQELSKPGRKHPFDGPEVFDDKVGNIRPIDKSLPRLSEVIAAKREEPKAEGDWQLEEGDRVGEDTD